MEQTDIVVIGAGAVGLAVAAEITARMPGRQVIILERHDRFGLETSSRNSEVIHAGIYYPSGSLKARLCVAGNALLYRFCEDHGVPCRRPGKLILAVSEAERSSLHTLMEQAAQNEVADLGYLEKAEVARLEPHVSARAAVFSPSTGIIDSHRLMSCLEQLARRGGALPAYCHEVVGVEPRGGGFAVRYRNPDGTADAIACSWLVNCAGLSADRVASWMGIDVSAEGYQIYPCKGEYFSVEQCKSKLVTRLVYPPPLKELAGLGIHATKTLDGRLRLGPNAIYTDKPDYMVNPEHAAEFFRSVKSFLPFLERADLEPEMAGIRPKLQGPGQPFRDFIIRHEAERGLPGAINLVGIESPGLTCCLAIARMVTGMITF